MKSKPAYIQVLFTIAIFFVLYNSVSNGQVDNNKFISSPWSLYFLNDKTGFVAGGDMSFKGEVWESTDGGYIWFKFLAADPDADYYYRVFAFNERDILLTGSRGKILKTTDAGLTWNNYSFPTYSGLADICFPSMNTGYIAGGDFFPNPVFIKTTNAGVNWVSMSHDTLYNLGTVKFMDENIGYAGGNRIIMKTTDGGKTYTEYFNDEFGLSCIEILDSSTAYASGGSNWGGGIIAKTDNSGINWAIIHREAYQVRKIRFLDKLTAIGITAGAEGRILKTKNGGINWDVDIIEKIETLTDICFVNDSTGWTTGRKDGQGFLYKTSDKGDHWTLQVAAIPKPGAYSLFQNYPNPFNPQTKIRYELPADGFVQIKIYDVLGRTLLTLVEKKQSIGRYEVEFDGSKYSSGVYFYSLEIDNNLIEAKKMILLK